MAENFKYYAFISYNSKDVAWGKRLQRKLEGYKMPSTLCSERGWQRRPIKPVFFAPTEIQPGPLTEELKARLRASRHLIVICSPRSAASQWVGREIEYFHSLGRSANIHFFIVEGTPNSGDPATECYNDVVRKLGLDDILGVNINEKNYKWSYLNRERAYIQLITKLLGIEFDAIWQRHKRLLAERITLFVMTAVAVIALVAWSWMAHRPVDICVNLKEITPHNAHIPQLSDAEVTLSIGDYERSKRVGSIDEDVVFTEIPHNLLGSHMTLSFVDFPDNPEAMNYYPAQLETTLTEQMTLPIIRDTLKYGHVRARFVDANYRPRPHYTTTIAGLSVEADASGDIDVHIPFSKQSYSYVVEQDTISDVGLCSRFAIIVE